MYVYKFNSNNNLEYEYDGKKYELKPTLIRPLGPIVFRWGGEYSPILTGPMNKGSSEPLPLPSTIAGFLYWISKGYTNEELKELDIQKDYDTISSKVEVFGPFFYVKDENRKICLAIHQYPKKLRVINKECEVPIPCKKPSITEEEKRVFEPVYINKIGIGHEISKKQAHTGLIYTVEYVDYYATAVERLGLKEVKEYGILVYTNADIKEGFYPFGSEGRLVEIREVKDKDLIKNALNNVFDYSIYILSPIILRSHSNSSSSHTGTSLDIDDIIIDKGNNEEIKMSDLAFKNVRLSLIGLGFNVKYNVKRPIYLAIMPGGFEAKNDKEKEKVKQLPRKLLNQISSGTKVIKLGLFDKIWGSMIIKGDGDGEQRQ